MILIRCPTDDDLQITPPPIGNRCCASCAAPLFNVAHAAVVTNVDRQAMAFWLCWSCFESANEDNDVAERLDRTLSAVEHVKQLPTITR